MYPLLKLLHILSSTVLFGTGLGTAFAMWRANATGDARVIAVVARNVVLADWLFTTPAVIVQPITGIFLTRELGYSLTTPWLIVTLALYALAGLCWVPVVGLQLKMRDLATQASHSGTPLPAAYHRHFRRWFALGWPAFLAVIGIFGLLVYKPVLWG